MKLEITEPAEKELAGLDKRTRARIKDALDKLLSRPEAVDLRKLKGKTNLWRLRVGEWRVILQVDRRKETIYVLHVKHRREAYRRLS